MNIITKRAAAPKMIALGILGSVILLAIFFAVRTLCLQAVLAGSADGFFESPHPRPDILLTGFPIYRQEYSNSCGPTTISMLYSYLIAPISEKKLSEKINLPLGQSGMLPDLFGRGLQSALEGSGYQVTHQVNVADTVFLEQTYQQIQKGYPVPVYFSTINDWDKSNYDTHFSVITGIRPQARTFIVANAYGFQEEIPFADMLKAMKFENYQNPPLDFRLGLFAGVINKNNFYLIQRK